MKFETLPPCLGCGFLRPDYMLKDSVWIGELGLTKKSCIYCLQCVEDLLSRKLTPDDFLPGVPVNDNFFFGYALGSGDKTSLNKHLRFREERTRLMVLAKKSPRAAQDLAKFRAEMQQ